MNQARCPVVQTYCGTAGGIRGRRDDTSSLVEQDVGGSTDQLVLIHWADLGVVKAVPMSVERVTAVSYKIKYYK